MTSKALITRPQHDKVTEYFAWWSNDILSVAEQKGVDLIDLGADQVTREHFENYLNKQKPSLIIINGHGNKDCFTGHDLEPLVIKDDNEKILKDKITYVRSCSSAARLGPASVAKGAKTFIGYRLPFSFLTNKNRSCTPSEDKLANIFKEPSNIIPISLLKGNSAEEADAKARNKYKELIRQYGTSNTDPDAQSIRRWLFWNMRAQVVLGDTTAKF